MFAACCSGLPLKFGSLPPAESPGDSTSELSAIGTAVIMRLQPPPIAACRAISGCNLQAGDCQMTLTWPRRVRSAIRLPRKRSNVRRDPESGGRFVVGSRPDRRGLTRDRPLCANIGPSTNCHVLVVRVDTGRDRAMSIQPRSYTRRQPSSTTSAATSGA